MLIFPLYDRVLVGTSDIKIDHPDEVRCTDEESDYFIGMVERVFPPIKVRRATIVFQFTGVRPLGRSGAKTTGQQARSVVVKWLSGDWTKSCNSPSFRLVGGKWTSFRAFSSR
ncbi:MAG: hypothetical protein IPO22_23940 [Anaerolineales bacterium]|nr:hypothetical protein [Anaerolineales bacterium]